MRNHAPRVRQLMLLVIVCWLVAGIFPLGKNALATEGGGGAYPCGADDFMMGALPPPGFYLIDYVNYYNATSLRDKHGDKLVPEFDLDAYANVLRFIYVSKRTMLGASWAMHAFVPLTRLEIDATMGKDKRSGLGDIIINPFILGWHFSKNLHVTAGIDCYLPVGAYDEDRLANIGRNYYTLEPVLGVTYLWDNGFELSAKFGYDFNGENSATDYQSGQEFHFDYTAGYHIDKNLSVGLGGYYYYQTTNDELDGEKVGTDGFKGRVMALGPQAAYNYKNMAFTLKWQKEFDAENRPEGSKLWGKFMYAF